MFNDTPSYYLEQNEAKSAKKISLLIWSSRLGTPFFDGASRAT